MSEHYARQAVCREIIKAVVDYEASGRTNMAQASGRAADAILDLLIGPHPSAEDVERVVTALRGIIEHFDRDTLNAPGHRHNVPGVWDADNAPGIAGTKCEWCAQWSEARAALSAMQR